MAWWIAQAALAGYALHQKIKGTRAQEDAAVRAAEARKKQIDLINEQAGENIRNRKIQGQKIFGRQIVGYAASGVDVSSGSPLSLLEDEGRKMHEEISRIRREADLQVEAIEAGIQAQIASAQAIGEAQRDAAWGSFALQGASIGANWYKHNQTIGAMEKQTEAIRGGTEAGVGMGRAAGIAGDVAMSGIALQKARLGAGGFGAPQVQGQFPKPSLGGSQLDIDVPSLEMPQQAPQDSEAWRNEDYDIDEYDDAGNLLPEYGGDLDSEIMREEDMSQADLDALDDLGASERLTPGEAEIKENMKEKPPYLPVDGGAGIREVSESMGGPEGMTRSSIAVQEGDVTLQRTELTELSSKNKKVFLEYQITDQGNLEQYRIKTLDSEGNLKEEKIMRPEDLGKVSDEEMLRYIEYRTNKKATKEQIRPYKDLLEKGDAQRSPHFHRMLFLLWRRSKGELTETGRGPGGERVFEVR